MAALSEELRASLKKPLGDEGTFDSLLPRMEGKKIIAVGDQAVYSLLKRGIRPHVAVFDFRTMRGPVDDVVRKRIEEEYPSPECIKNPAGTISEALFLLVPSLMRSGGALRVEGEEDLAAIPFIHMLKKGYVVLYGQPGAGCVLVDGKSKGRKTVEKVVKALGLASLPDRL
ncbi:MAG: DUF359 domain-containing protein [Candidatus ainarchaeum sp.]|nr:DUF359 domain-containing protein [Candidatus ainarchaeum sp.]MDD5096244.1 DUF359 domain-containing protein [Candidatus ainarchaeum sp.]